MIRTHVISLRIFALSLLVMLFALSACGQSTTTTGSGGSNTQAATPTATPIVDAYGTPVSVPKSAPQRIISLAPNISEILAALKLQSKVVGVDYNTNYPAVMASKKKVTSMSGVNVEQIVALKPDLVLSDNGLTKTYESQLEKLGLDVVDLPGANIAQTLTQITSIGQLTHTQGAAQTIVTQMQQQISQIQNQVKGAPTPKVLLEVDDSTPGKPYVFGGGSFGDDLLQYADATNIFHENTQNGGFPQVADEAVIAANPQYIILTEDPLYGGNPALVYKRANWQGIAAVKSHQVYHINSDIIQRPDPRIVEGLRCVAQIVHPDKFTGALPGYCTGA